MIKRLEDRTYEASFKEMDFFFPGKESAEDDSIVIFKGLSGNYQGSETQRLSLRSHRTL